VDKNDIMRALDEVLVPLGFKRKGNNWKVTSDMISKQVQLQRSNFGNQYYINYGFNFPDLDFDAVEMHIFRRFGSADQNEQKRIQPLLDLENGIESGIESGIGGADLRRLFEAQVVPQLQAVNNKEEAIQDISKRTYFDVLTIKVKEYLGING